MARILHSRVLYSTDWSYGMHVVLYLLVLLMKFPVRKILKFKLVVAEEMIV